jgi:hypothetical protein
MQRARRRRLRVRITSSLTQDRDLTALEGIADVLLIVVVEEEMDLTISQQTNSQAPSLAIVTLSIESRCDDVTSWMSIDIAREALSTAAQVTLPDDGSDPQSPSHLMKFLRMRRRRG